MHTEWISLPAVDISTVFGWKFYNKRVNTIIFVCIRWLISCNLMYFVRTGLQATTCQRIWWLNSIGKRIPCVFWHTIYSQRFTDSWNMVKSTSFLLNRGDTFVRTAVSIKLKKKTCTYEILRDTSGIMWAGLKLKDPGNLRISLKFELCT